MAEYLNRLYITADSTAPGWLHEKTSAEKGKAVSDDE
jgi:hypothetical protein